MTCNLNFYLFLTQSWNYYCVLMPFWSWKRKYLFEYDWKGKYRIVMIGLHWWAFQQRSCREIRDWRFSELLTIPAIYTSYLLISGGRALLGRFACVEAANGRIRRQPFSLSFSYDRHLSFPTCGHWELRSLWLMLLSMRHDPLYPYEASLQQFTSFFQLGLNSVCALSQPLEV